MASIAKRPDGQYRARYRDEAGTEHSRHFDRKIDAQQWLDQVTAAVVTGQYVDPKSGRITFADFYAAVEQPPGLGRRYSSLDGYHRAVGDLRRAFPSGRCGAPTSKGWVKSMSSRGLAASTITTAGQQRPRRPPGRRG